MTDPLRNEESGVVCEQVGDDWVVEAPEIGPIILKNRVLANKIFQMAHGAYWRGRRDAFKELRELIGATP